MENQWLQAALTDPFAQASPANEIGSKFGVFTAFYIPGHDLPTPHIHH
jgi:hypothetical protein